MWRLYCTRQCNLLCLTTFSFSLTIRKHTSNILFVLLAINLCCNIADSVSNSTFLASAWRYFLVTFETILVPFHLLCSTFPLCSSRTSLAYPSRSSLLPLAQLVPSGELSPSAKLLASALTTVISSCICILQLHRTLICRCSRSWKIVDMRFCVPSRPPVSPLGRHSVKCGGITPPQITIGMDSRQRVPSLRLQSP